ncbi:sulfate transporter CysZ [Thiohalobacter sp. IOR34]|uniref:sulfate transporter CysZ n=1 Tax=Thiohalobacter sp. IOR34 TaxID=3057176 RepID=UPI0025B1D528|nr:sulfate transporter CysZ [Thiohalobacter sp. IOR34]WJW76526.1 sulfate transporter CysZ [Thiohalobacter sp. IOR34]
MRDFIQGLGFVASGLQLIRQPRLRRFVLVPLAINLLLFAGLIGFAASEFGRLMDYLLGFLPDWLAWLRYLLWPLFAASVLLVVFYGFSILANLIAAPFNGLLAEAVERHLTGQSLEGIGGWRQILRDILPSLWSEVQKLLYFLLRALPVGLCFLIPGLNLAAPVLWGLFSAWMLALEYADYPLNNHRLLFPAQRRLLGSRRLLTLGFGSGVLLMTLIPVINFIAMPTAVAGATALWVRALKGRTESG